MLAGFPKTAVNRLIFHPVSISSQDKKKEKVSKAAVPRLNST